MTTSISLLLDELCAFGPRFHGSPAAAQATDFLENQLKGEGVSVMREEVVLPGWTPGNHHQVTLLAPESRLIRSWPMLWSGPTEGVVRGSVVEYGPQGLWADSMVWRKFAVVDKHGATLAFLHARDDGPAAPQPLPSSSDFTIAHLSIGRIDGLQLSEWLSDGFPVEMEVSCTAGPAPDAAGHNLIVDIPGQGTGHVLLTAHSDTFYNTVGAYDNGSGTIALLLLAQHWMRRPPGPSVRLVFCTAEEWHLAGSRQHVSSLNSEQLDAIDYIVNIDGLGRGDLLELFCGPETFEAATLKVLRDYSEKERPDLRIISRFPPIKGTDDAAFYAAGVPTIFMTFNDLHRLHQPEDLPNDGISMNIEFTVPLVAHLIDTLHRPSNRPSRLEVL